MNKEQENQLPAIVRYQRNKRLAMRQLEDGYIKGAIDSMLEAHNAHMELITSQAQALMAASEKLRNY